MTIQQLITLGITASLVALVFSLGLKGKSGDLLYLVRRPGKLVRSLIAMNVIMLAFVIGAVLVVPLAPEIKIALIALAVSPVPPILPGKQAKAGGTHAYALSLLVVASVAAIVLVPVSIGIVGWIFGADIHMPASRVVRPVLVTVIAPMVLGVLFRRLFPALAERIARPLTLLAVGLLLVSALPVVITSGKAFWAQTGDGVVLCLVLFTAVGLTVGHLLGGPEPRDRAVLALAAGTRHPGVAIAIATLNYPNDKATLAVMLWHLVIGAIVAIPYVRWQRSRLAEIAAVAQDSAGGGSR